MKSKIDVVLKKDNDILKIHYSTLNEYKNKSSSIVFNSLKEIEKGKVIELFSKAFHIKNRSQRTLIREELYTLLERKYKLMNKIGIEKIHFVFADNISFLRMHKPSKWGDNLFDVRKDIVYVNKYKKNISGFSACKSSHSFRNIYPIYDSSKRFIGVVDLGYSGKLLENSLSNINGIHSHFLVNKNVFDAKNWKRDNFKENYMQSAEHKEYFISMTQNNTKKKCIEQNIKKLSNLKEIIKDKISIGDRFSIYAQNDDEYQAISFYPVKDSITDNVSAWVVSYSDSTLIKEIIKNMLYVKIISIIILVLLFTLLYFLLKEKIYLKQLVDVRTKELLDLNENLENKILSRTNELEEKNKQLLEQSKLVSMSELLQNIAHQYRQPLSTISTSASGMLVKSEYGMLDDDEIIDNCNLIIERSNYLSNVLENFNTFMDDDNESERLNTQLLSRLIFKAMKADDIKLIVDIEDDVEIEDYTSHLMQILLNIFQNSIDAFEENNQKEKFIFVTTQKNNEFLTIKIKDNAGGMVEDNLPRIFEPYFTTKHKSEGKGLGLDLVYRFIKYMGGTIKANNIEYQYSNKQYQGLELIIKFEVKS
ncbi:MAG: ATP-binding protein [Campylobacterota bacterium]|nr:ATP-binding protein [Campylobacterota bacterium]